MIYIITCGYSSGLQKVVKAYTTLSKAKKFCKENYGISPQDWTYNEKEKYYFYDPSSKQKIDIHYDTFNIFLIEVEE